MLNIKNVTKVYKTKSQEVVVLNKINLQFGSKGFIVLLGKSGSGKSTLLNLIGGLDSFDSGEILIKGKSTKEFSVSDWDNYRNSCVGFVFQESYLIEEYTIGENIALALELQGYLKDCIDEKVKQILNLIGLDNYKNRYPNELSGGQKQRIAIARALIKNPQIILCDEPTGNLDSETGYSILEMLKKLSETKLVIMITHDREFANMFGDRIIELKDGEIVKDNLNNTYLEHEKIYDGDDDFKKIINIPKGKKLSNRLINYLNDILINDNNDIYLTISDVSFVDDFVNDSKINENNKIDIFHDEEISEFTMKNSSFSYKSAFKLAFISLFKKKLRLILMSILFIFSLTFVGVALSLTFYNPSYAALLTFDKANISYVPLYKTTYRCNEKNDCYNKVTSFTDNDIVNLQSNYNSIKIYRSIYKNIKISDLVPIKEKIGDSLYYQDEFNKIVFLDNTSFQLVYGSYPSNLNEVLLTDYMAEMLIYYEAYEISNIEDLIDKTFTYNEQPLIIKGIVKTDISHYEYLKKIIDVKQFDNLGFYDDYKEIYAQIFMKEATYEAYFKDDIFTLLNVDVTYSDKIDYSLLLGELPKKDDEIVVTATYLNQIFKENIDLTNLNDEELSKFLGNSYTFTYRSIIEKYSSGSSYEEISKVYKVVGIIKDVDNDVNYGIAFYRSELDYLKDESGDWLITATAILGKNTSENYKLLRQIDNLNYRHLTSLSYMLYNVKDTVEDIRLGLFITGAVFIIFASILILTFISSSINYKQKDIGILRALGAKGKDVAKIFIIEGLFIILFSSIIANVLSSISIIFINNFVTKRFELKIVLIYVNIYSIILVFIIAILVVLLSSFVPIKRISKMKPVKVIKNN